MKPGMSLGTVSEVSFVVTPEMRAAFEGEVVHDVLATAAMITYMEWAARKIILPFLDDTEEGVGYEVNVRHIAPAPVGVTVTCSAVLTAAAHGKVVTAVEAYTLLGRIGEGTFTQAIVSRSRFLERIRGNAKAVVSPENESAV